MNKKSTEISYLKIICPGMPGLSKNIPVHCAAVCTFCKRAARQGVRSGLRRTQHPTENRHTAEGRLPGVTEPAMTHPKTYTDILKKNLGEQRQK